MKQRNWMHVVAVLIMVVALAACVPGATSEPVGFSAFTVVWETQFGTSRSDQLLDMTTDSLNNIIVSGATYGALSGESLGDYDAFVRKLNPNGEEVWTHQFGTPGRDAARALAVLPDNSILVAGDMVHNENPQNRYVMNAYVAKLSASGDEVWRTYISEAVEPEASGSVNSATFGIAADANGDVVVLSNGTNGRLLLVKLNRNGQYAWHSELSPGGKNLQMYAPAVAIGEDNSIYFAGFRQREAGVDAFSVFVAKYRSDGVLQWQVDLAGDTAFRSSFISTRITWGLDLALGPDNQVVVAMEMVGDEGYFPSPGGADVVVATVDASGNFGWATQIATNRNDSPTSVTVNGAGAITVAGWTAGSLAAENPRRNLDAFIAQLAPNGAMIFQEQFAASGGGVATPIAIATHDLAGDMVLGTSTALSLGGQNVGELDVYVLKARR